MVGGADALALAKQNQWERDKTVIIGLDGLSGGDLHYAAEEGEIFSHRIARSALFDVS